ncbi:potassium uptake protein, TrkH family [Thermanaerovibrio acidaminovorans DSM 6589]|uniref:Potassium uptake protein, TrkH family n=1 Tax=Thermanaerovibrio acidaminovorans (strain ATCC 49978 / DSM 6589 / Su883) TaxID=525903 RepID=D1B9K7_THEAS|nr:potassium uptake protein, TrkH family [Thermanaerovibrio acidaminovorans DSM 6589]
MVYGFLLLIAAGALALWGIGELVGRPLDPIDALFTATSAVCVTGLSTVDVGTALPLPSQLVLLLLIQLGGLGVMAATTSFYLMLGAKVGFKERLAWAESMGLDTPRGAIRLLLLVIRVSLIAETVMAVPLFVGFARREGAVRGAYMAIFHSISAFCNAGFSPYSDSLVSFATEPLVMLPITVLIVVGGLGFPVLDDVLKSVRSRRWRPSSYTRVVLTFTPVLILLGSVVFLLGEINGVLRDMPWPHKLINALFMSVTPRTAGFNSVPLGRMSGVSLLFTSFLMWVGANPSSTGGGVKVTTFAVLWSSCTSEIRGRSDVCLARRHVDWRTQRKAITVAVLYTLAVFVAVFMLAVFEPEVDISSLVFEAISAMGTVGLSLGVTPHLSPDGKMVLIFLMYWGRVGIVTFLYSIFRRHEPGRVSLPNLDMPIG